MKTEQAIRLRTTIILLMLGACIPTNIPGQLSHTPEPAVVISSHTVDNGRIQARYPDGWEVVTGMENAQTLVFARGDAWMILSTQAVQWPTPQPSFQTEKRDLLLHETSVTAVLNAPRDEWESVLPVFEQILDSLTIPN